MGKKVFFLTGIKTALVIAPNNNATMSEEGQALSRQMSIDSNDTDFGQRSTQELNAALDELADELKVDNNNENLSTMRDKMKDAVEKGKEHDAGVTALR